MASEDVERCYATTADCVPLPGSEVVPTAGELDAIEDGPEGVAGDGGGR